MLTRYDIVTHVYRYLLDSVESSSFLRCIQKESAKQQERYYYRWPDGQRHGQVAADAGY